MSMEQNEQARREQQATMQSLRGQTYSRSPARKQKSTSSFSWGLVIFLFIVCWPVGLGLAIWKLAQGRETKKITTSTAASKKKAAKSDGGRKTARVLQIIGAVLAVIGGLTAMGIVADLGFYLEYGDFWWFFEDVLPSLTFFAGGVGLLALGGSFKRRLRRFTTYLAAAGKQNMIPVQRLAGAAKVSSKQVEKDLEIMIDQGMWGEDAYLDLSAGQLFRSESAAGDYYAAQQQPQEPQQEESAYAALLADIRRANDRIDDEVLSAKISRLEEIAGRIFHLVETDPEKQAKASTFLNYYMPTTQKLLDSYAEFEEADIQGANVDAAKAKIEKTMDDIVRGFERQLDELYRSDAMDIDSDIRVMETMLRRDHGTVADDFGLHQESGQN